MRDNRRIADRFQEKVLQFHVLLSEEYVNITTILTIEPILVIYLMFHNDAINIHIKYQ